MSDNAQLLQARFTPGPWAWDFSAGPPRLVQADTSATVLQALVGDTPGFPTVAVNSQEWDGPPYMIREVRAADGNAVLIAAAPDLLAACLAVANAAAEARRAILSIGPCQATADLVAKIGYHAERAGQVADRVLKGGAA